MVSIRCYHRGSVSDVEERLVRTKPDFDPVVHRAILFRCVLMEMPKETIASIIGITPATLDAWVDEHVVLQQAIVEAKGADSKVTAALFYAAIGLHPEMLTPLPPSVQAMKLWLMERQGWFQTDKGGKNGRRTLEDMSAVELAELVGEINAKVRRSALDVPPAGDVPAAPVVDAHDPGF